MEDLPNQPESANLVSLTTDIVSAYVSNNTVPVSDVPSLIASVHNSLVGLETGATVAAPSVKSEILEPKVPIKKSVQNDFIVCLEDGKRFKSLRRHLKSAYNMTPEDYRKKWGLAADYPMVAPSYAAARSKLAKNMGLGRKAATK